MRFSSGHIRNTFLQIMESITCVLPCSNIKLIKKHFLSGSDLKLLNFKDFLSHINTLKSEDQANHVQSLIDETVSNCVLKDKPLKVSYVKYFIKILLIEIEKLKLDNTNLYEIYVQVLNSSHDIKYHYRHFVINEKIVTVRENVNIISNGTTGMSIWHGGIALADWCLNNPKIVEDETILELGCGLGLTGLIVTTHNETKHYCFTDFNQEVLESVKYNLSINSSSNNHSVLKLDWSSIKESDITNNPSIVFGADIIYDPDLFPSLYNTLKLLVVEKGATCYLSCTVRDKNTLNLFLKDLTKHCLCVESILKLKPSLLIFSEDPPILLIKIVKKSDSSVDEYVNKLLLVMTI